MLSREVLKWLSHNKFFRGVPESQLRQLDADLFQEKTFQTGERIISQGVVIDEMYLLISGKMQITKLLPEGSEVELAERLAGDFIGEISLLDEMETTANVICIVSSKVLAIKEDALLKIFNQIPRVSKNIFKEISFRLRESNEKIATMLDQQEVITDDSFEWLVPYMVKEEFKKGETIFQKGDNAEKMYYIKEGKLRLHEIDTVVGAGNVIGEMGLFSPFKERTATAICEEDLEIYALGKDETIKLFYRNPYLALKLVNISTERFINNYTKSIAAKKKIEAELNIAREIQISALPSVFPPFPHRKDIEIFASMKPAKEVGGDLYDFFFIDENKFCFLIGDVSGKGVPAALFMMIVKTLLKTEAKRGASAPEVLKQVNEIICPDNNACMFVTVLCAILDTETGELELGNAGHNPPLIYRDGEKFEYYHIPKSLVLGPINGIEFTSATLKLNPNDIVFLYTDGVTEALNPDEKLYSEKRLETALNHLTGKNVTEIINGVREDIKRFVENAPQSDDITMVALEYKGIL